MAGVTSGRSARDAGLPPDEALVERLYQQRLQTKALPYARVEAPLLHTLAEIKRRGLRLGLLSDCAPEDAAPWPASPLAPLFDAAVFSYQVGTAKPDPACYHIVCARLGVPPAQALFVGDGAHDELAGAAHAGLVPYRAEWFRDRWPDWQRARPDRASAMAFPSLGTLAELLAAVDAAGA